MADNEVSILVKLKDEISTGLNKLNDSFKVMRERTDDVKRNYEAMGKAGKSMAIGFGAMAASLDLLIYTTAKLAGENEAAVAKLNQTLRNAGVYSKQYSDRLQEQATALQKVTTFDDEAIISAQAAFARYRLNEEQIKRLTAATLDLAAFTGEDLNSAALKVARSVGTNTNALMRNGIALEGVAGSAERAESAIKNINAQVGGQAIAAANTYEGALKNLKNVQNEAGEQLGKQFLPYLKQLTFALRDVADWFSQLNPKILKIIASIVGIGAVTATVTAGLYALVAAVPFVVSGFASIGVAANIALAGIPIIIGTITTGALLMYNALNKGPKSLEEANKRYAELTGQIQQKLKDVAEAKKRFEEDGKKGGYLESAYKIQRQELAQLEEQLKKVIEAQKAFKTKPNAGGGVTPLDMPDQKKTLEQQLKDFEDSEKAKTSVLEQEAQKRIEILSTQKATEEEIAIASDELELGRLATKQQNLDAFEAQKNEKSKQMKEFVAKQEADNQIKKIKLEEDLRKKKDEKAIKDFNTFNDFMKAGTTSKSKEVAAISKALAIYEIGVNTYKAAMAGYSAMAGIPWVGPALGAAAAAAAIAFGGEQIQAVSAQQPQLAEGGIVPATNGGRSVTVAEAGQDEAIIPLDKADGMLGGDLSVNLNVDGIKLANVFVQNYNKARNLNLTTKLSTT